MSYRLRTWALVAAACLTSVALATSVWTGDVPLNDRWDACDNWLLDREGEPCYPDDGDVLIGYTAGGYDVELIEGIRIDNLTITGSVDFSPGSGEDNPILLVDEIITISGGSGGSTVRMTPDAEIRTYVP